MEKKCIICDKKLIDQKSLYDSNHYLCSEECLDKYKLISNYDFKNETYFITSINKLNNFRKMKELHPLTEKEIYSRKD